MLRFRVERPSFLRLLGTDAWGAVGLGFRVLRVLGFRVFRVLGFLGF